MSFLTETFRRVAIVVMLATCGSQAAEPKFYAEFLKACGTNNAPFQVSMFRRLVDTNNIHSKVSDLPISLVAAKTKGEVNGVRLGMSMDEVVLLRGKPNFLGCCVTNRPCFSYDDVILQFAGDEVVGIELRGFLPWTPRFSHNLVPISRMDQWLRVLGEPAKTFTNGSSVHFQYQTNQTVLIVRFDTDEKQLWGFKLAKAGTLPATNQKP